MRKHDDDALHEDIFDTREPTGTELSSVDMYIHTRMRGPSVSTVTLSGPTAARMSAGGSLCNGERS